MQSMHVIGPTRESVERTAWDILFTQGGRRATTRVLQAGGLHIVRAGKPYYDPYDEGKKAYTKVPLTPEELQSCRRRHLAVVQSEE